MFDRTFAVFLGKNSSDFAAGFVVEDGFFCVLEIAHPEAENKLRIITEKIRESLKEQNIKEPQDLANFAKHLIDQHKLTSFSSSYLYQSQIFTYVFHGSIILCRQKKLYLASRETEALGGKFDSLDNYIFLTQSIDESPLNHELEKSGQKQPKEIVEDIKENLTPEKGVILVVQTTAPEPQATETVAPAEPVLAASSASSNYGPMNNPSPFLNIIKGKWLKLFILIAVLLFISIQGIAAVKTSLEKRREQNLTKELSQINSDYQILEKQLQSKPTEAIKNIADLKARIQTLSDNYANRAEVIKPLQDKIISLEKTYGNAQITQEKLFFDLSLIDKKAQADYLDVTENNISILDNQNKKAYLINISNKNVTEADFDKIETAELVTEYNDTLYLYNQKNGIYIDTDGKFAKIISKNKNWGKIIDLDIFNSNIYLLSQSQDEIFKFTPTEDGYSSNISYFQPGESIDLSAAKNMAIDFSVYILGGKIYKYTAGSLSDFKSQSQLDYQNLIRIHKSQDNNYLYLLDSANSRVVAINEDGRLIKSIFNPKLKDTRYFGVYRDEKIVFLRQNKLYQLDNF